jgi:DNA-binding CsgD family transcriptional regulator
LAIDLVGRSVELAALDVFLASIVATPPAPRAIVLEGPAGIGKSALWAEGVDRARARGIDVLAARPAEVESSFAFQGLSDLLAPLSDEIAVLPPPQRRSLEVALLRQDPTDGQPLDAQAVALAATSAVRGAAARRPLLIAIDDAPWLDAGSAAVLRFVARRLGDRRVGLLLSQRVDEPRGVPLDLDQGISTARHWLGPLGRAELHELLAQRLGLVLPRATLARLDDQSQGNPFHALEIGRALQRLPALPKPGEPLPIPDSVRTLIGNRLAVVSDAARDLLLLAALAGSPSPGLLQAASGRPVAELEQNLAEAVDAGLITIEGSNIRFNHPLIASTLVAAAAEGQRRAAHRALARAAREPEVRARHLAHSTVTPDAGTAEALEEAAVAAQHRGAGDAAVELFRSAVDLTPIDDGAEVARRRVRLGMALFHQADLPAARSTLEGVLDALPPGRLKAEALVARANIDWYVDRGPSCVRYAEQALLALDKPVQPHGSRGDDPDLDELVARIYLRLALFHDDYVISHGYREAAVGLLAARGGPAYAAALLSLFWSEISIGLPPDLEKLRHGLELEERGDAEMTTIPGLWWTATGELDRARERFAWMREAGRRMGDLSGEADLLTHLAHLELYADDWPRARALIDEARILATQEGQAEAIPALRVRALLDAHEGSLDAAAVAAQASADASFARGDVIVGVALLNVLAFVAASRGDAAEVERMTGMALAHLRRLHLAEPLRLDPVPERIEALAALGRLDEAEELLEDLTARARLVPRPWVDAALARGRALLLLARGNAEGAAEATAAAMDRSSAWRSFDRARTQLVRGRLLRQLRRPRDAGAALDVALSTFERLGAKAWADQAGAELRRLGRTRSGGEELTPAERQVGELAASGLRNREVADQLGISSKTVEAHLARVYAKLGIRSRAELGRAIAPQGGRGDSQPM